MSNIESLLPECLYCASVRITTVLPSRLTVKDGNRPPAPDRLHRALPEADYTVVMHVRAALWTIALLAALTFGPGATKSQAAPGDGDRTSLSSQLRYLGRDPLTGMPARVDDRFIAEIEHAIERYGKDAGTPVPPPPVSGADVASVTIAKLGLSNVPVARFGLDAYGRLDVPQDARTIGWNPAYNELPGLGGATFFAAHFEYGGRPGVFNKLTTLQPGDSVSVRLTDGSEHRYAVTSTIDYDLAAIDMGAVLKGREGGESITLMTCSGPPGEDGYPSRTVVLAQKAD